MKKYDKERLIEILKPYDNKNILLLLQVIQENFSYISNEHIIFLSERTNIPCSQIESILSFYKFFNRKKINYTIRICQTISCDLKNKGNYSAYPRPSTLVAWTVGGEITGLCPELHKNKRIYLFYLLCLSSYFYFLKKYIQKS